MAASSSHKRRKDKQPMEENREFDAWRYRSVFHEIQAEWMRPKTVLAEVPFDLEKDEFPGVWEKIKKRKWELLTKPITKININLVKEFYANAVREDPTKKPTYKSYVRGVEVDFSPKAIMKTLGLKNIHFSQASYEERMIGEPDYTTIAEDLCAIRAEWVRKTRGAPRVLRRGDLTPEAKGWYAIVRRSILPTANSSEIVPKRAILLHCIMVGGEIKVHKLIAEQIQEFSEKSDPESWLHFPSTIIRLCIDAQVPLEDERPNWLYPGLAITAYRMTLGPTPPRHTRRRNEEGQQVEAEQEAEQEGQEGEDREEEQEEQAIPERRQRIPRDPMDMSRMQEIMEGMSQQYMRSQERQEDFHLKMMDMQRNFESRFLDLQREQNLHLQESFSHICQHQDANVLAIKEATTLQNARYSVQADYNISSQIKLNYIGEHLHKMDPAFPAFDEYFKGRKEGEINKAMILEKGVEETMKKAGFWKKLIRKDKGSTSGQKEAGSKKKQDPKN